MRGIALVGLNSLYRSGATAFLAHLGSVLDWEDDKLIVFNESAEPKEDDIEDYVAMTGYIRDTDADILEDYQHVIFAAPRWGGNYTFLPKYLKSVRIVIHDINDFDRMGMWELIEKYPNAMLFSVDDTVRNRVAPKYIKKIKQPFNRDLMPKPLPHSEKRKFLVTSRPTPSKNHDLIRKMTKGYSLNVLGANGIYTYPELAEAYADAVGVIDASIFPEPHRRSQYSLLESWHFGCPFLCFKEWFDQEEVIPEMTVLEFNVPNLRRIYDNKHGISEMLTMNGEAALSFHDPDVVWKYIMEEM